MSIWGMEWREEFSMSKDGKWLEHLVRQIEELFLPLRCTVEANRKVYDEGCLIAEFDLEIRGRFGSTNIAWLIECRDRPSEGPQPGSWIEQLVSRRERFRFDRVTAVSTTGFAAGAMTYARKKGIELRHVREITAEDVRSWCVTQELLLQQPYTRLDDAQISIASDEPQERREAFVRRLQGTSGETKLLRAIDTGETISIAEAFTRAVSQHPELFADIAPEGPSKPIRLSTVYPDDQSHFVIDTDCGSIRITAIIFIGELSNKITAIPSSFREYAHYETGEPITQSMVFLVDAQRLNFSLEIHQIAESSELDLHFFIHKTK